MIYGINFNGSEIPPGVKRMFAQRVRVMCSSCGGLGFYRAQTADGEEDTEICEYCRKKGKLTYELKGVAQSLAERDAMLVQANNGTRRLHVVARKTAAGIWYGIYCW